ncbi:hypothetical protein OC25_20025 [Pedobacter kyungheensis]|uniref:Uncharacterized protein n=1 Tax=Pedobacter kyungheensis TaxID=1069985 RepID=A0A0C1FIQ1_9SPHI|nr:hypothetical protein OC25_20025 [Pedobacter kyungheensis]
MTADKNQLNNSGTELQIPLLDHIIKIVNLFLHILHQQNLMACALTSTVTYKTCAGANNAYPL